MYKTITIIGGGWYGCHIALFLKSHGYIVKIIEKNSEIFDNSSFYNQNRLHLGYHYPRDFATRSLCKNNYDKFIARYTNIVDKIDNNYYLISKKSILDYDTYEHIYSYENFEFSIKENILFNDIYSTIICVNEQVINSNKAKKYFTQELSEQNIQVICNTEVVSVNTLEDKINITDSNNNNYTCDMVLDCTYNQLGLLTDNFEYELTISLVFKRMQNTAFDAITIMDGKFLSLYPRDIDKELFTLTDVEYTPIIKSKNYNDIKNYIIKDEEIESIKLKMIDKCKHYYPEFEDNFEYESYFISKKTKQISQTDSRDITIREICDNIISVNCGKIYGIFEFENYIKKKLI
jgi:hypothetical protein